MGVLLVALLVVISATRASAASPAPTGTGGSSCVLSNSVDALVFDASFATGPTGTEIEVRCNWSPYDAAAHTSMRPEFRPFHTGCQPMCVPYSPNPVPSTVTFYGPGTVTAMACSVLVASWVVVDAPDDLDGAWRFRCSSKTVSGSTSVASAMFVANGTTLAVGGYWGMYRDRATAASSSNWTNAVSRSTWANRATAEPTLTWAPLPACLQLRMFIATPGRSIEPGATMAAEFTDGWEEVIASETVVLRRRWSPTDPWVEFYNGNTSTVSPPAAWTFTNDTSGPRTGVTFEVHCAGAGGAYIRGDNSEGGVTPQPSTPCSTLVPQWPDEGTFGANEEVDIGFSVGASGNVTGVSLGGGKFGDVYSHTITEVTDTATVTFGDPDGVPQGFPVDEGAYMATFSFTQQWSTDDGLYLVCTDAVGGKTFQYQAPAGVGKAVAPEGYGDRFDECMNGVNFGWRPSSWVPSFLRTGTCLAQVIFVPSEADLQHLVDSGDAMAEKAPVSYAIEIGGMVYSLVDDMPDSIADHRHECIAGIPLGFDSTAAPEFCPIAYEDTFEEIRFFAGLLLWAVFGIFAYQLVRKTIA